MSQAEKIVERRTLFGSTLKIENRSEGDSELPKISGYSALYDNVTEIPGYWGDGWEEVIKFGFFDKALSEKHDVRALFNHDQNYVLGRSTSPKKTLKLSQDKTGLLAEIVPPNNSIGKDVVESIERGDITGQSFAFTIDQENWVSRKGKPLLRELVAIGTLYDVGPVTYPAFPDTDIGVDKKSRRALAEVCARGLKQSGNMLPPSLVSELRERSFFQVPQSFSLGKDEIAELRSLIREEVVAALQTAKEEGVTEEVKETAPEPVKVEAEVNAEVKTEEETPAEKAPEELAKEEAKSIDDELEALNATILEASAEAEVEADLAAAA